MASRGARVPARAGGPQRARLVQGEPCPLRRVPPRSGAGARRGPRRPRTAAPLPSLEQHALPTGPAAEGAHRAGDRLRGRGGFYLELSLDGLLVAAGLHAPLPDQVDRLRRGIDAPRTAAALT